MIYEASKGYGLKFTKFDEQYQDTIIYRNTKEQIIRLADIIICSFGRKGLMEELNDMQLNAMHQVINGQPAENSMFNNKFEIPLYFINLLLEKHNMKILGE